METTSLAERPRQTRQTRRPRPRGASGTLAPLARTRWFLDAHSPSGRVTRYTGMLAVSLLDIVGTAGRELAIGWWLLVTDLAVGAAAYVLVAFRHRWPLPVALILAMGSTVSISSSGPGLLALASLARHRRLPELVAVVLVSAAGWIAFEAIVDSPMPWWQVVLFTAIALVGAAAMGGAAGPAPEPVRRGGSRTGAEGQRASSPRRRVR